MKRIALIALLALPACKAEEFVREPTTTCGNGVIDPAESCDGHVVSCVSLDPIQWIGGATTCVDCQIDTSSCTPWPPVAQYEECTHTSQCTAPQQCAQLTRGTETRSLCLRPCDGSAGGDPCGFGSACSGPTTTEWCLQELTVEDGDCQSMTTTCGGGFTCVPTNTNAGAVVNRHCKRLCGHDEFDSQGSCMMGETCLQSFTMSHGPQLELELDVLSAEIPCTLEGEVDVCDGPAGYRCWRQSLRDPSLRCARRVGWCTTRPTATMASAMTANEAAASPITTFTAYPQHLCAPAPAFVFIQTIPTQMCHAPMVSGEQAIATCAGPPGIGAGLCVGICNTGAGPDLDCGPLHTCTDPTTADSFFWETEKDMSQADIDCEMQMNAACDTAASFNCTELIVPGGMSTNWRCAKPLRYCEPN